MSIIVIILMMLIGLETNSHLEVCLKIIHNVLQLKKPLRILIRLGDIQMTESFLQCLLVFGHTCFQDIHLL